MSTIFSTSDSLNVSGPLMQIRINRSRVDSLRDVLSGVQIKFITENPRSTFDVVGGIRSDVLNNVAVFENCINELSAAKYL